MNQGFINQVWNREQWLARLARASRPAMAGRSIEVMGFEEWDLINISV